MGTPSDTANFLSSLMGASAQEELLALRLPAGLEDGRLIALEGHEALSRMYQFDLTIAAPAWETLGQEQRRALREEGVAFAVQLGGQTQWRHGLVEKISGPDEDGLWRFRVVPRLHRLTRRADCRVFRGLSVPEIVRQVLKRHDIAVAEGKLDREYRPLAHCAQYRETDANFVLRLLEQEGIYFYFTHSAEGHSLAMGDSPLGYKTASDLGELRVEPRAGDDALRITHWLPEEQPRPARYTVSSYDPSAPRKNLLASAPLDGAKPVDDFLEIYEPSYEYTELPDGERYACDRLEREETCRQWFTGRANVPGFLPGHVFSLGTGPQKGEYLVAEVRHSATAPSAATGGVSHFAISFTCLPAERTFRPAPLTPPPMIAGTQTAWVVGPDGETAAAAEKPIDVDSRGRVRIRLRWERPGDGARGATWVRVMQPWAGRDGGSFAVPRIGQEVLVSFDEGDPDRPVVIGVLPNAAERLPVDPARHPRRSVLGGSLRQGGQLRFDDAEQRLGIGAHELVQDVGRDWHTNVGGDRVQTVNGSAHARIDGDRVESIGGACRRSVAGAALEQAEAVHCHAQRDILWEAGERILLRVGGNYLMIDQAGIALNGKPLLKFNCAGDAPPARALDAPKPLAALRLEPDNDSRGNGSTESAKA